MRYRRDRTAGGTYFFTVVTHERLPILASPEAVDALRSAFRKVRSDRPFVIKAIVVLPDHLHTLWTLPEGDADYSMRWRLIKRSFSAAVDARSRVWQNRFWEHRVRDETDWCRHIDYIHWNPVKHGIVNEAWEWPYSSFNTHVQRGTYPADWHPIIEPALTPPRVPGPGHPATARARR